MSSDPHAPRRVNATIKHPESKRYAGDNPWLTFEGDVEGVREQIIAAFNMADTDGLSLAELVSEAQTQFTAIANAKAGLGGGKVLSSGKSDGQSSGGGNAWDNVKSGGDEAQAQEEKPKEPEENPVITAINGCTSIQELQVVWAENQAAFSDDAVMAAYKSKGKSLQG